MFSSWLAFLRPSCVKWFNSLMGACASSWKFIWTYACARLIPSKPKITFTNAKLVAFKTPRVSGLSGAVVVEDAPDGAAYLLHDFKPASWGERLPGNLHLYRLQTLVLCKSTTDNNDVWAREMHNVNYNANCIMKTIGPCKVIMSSDIRRRVCFVIVVEDSNIGKAWQLRGCPEWYKRFGGVVTRGQVTVLERNLL